MNFSAAHIALPSLLELFLSLFPNRNDSLVRQPREALWRAVSRFHYLSDDEIVDSIQINSKINRAVRLENATQFMVIAAKEGSRYRSIENIAPLKRDLASAFLQFRHYQSDEDWYLYLFLDDWIRTDVASSLIADWLMRRGFELGALGLEVLKNGDILPLPLQPRFAWLNDQCQIVVRREQISLESALALFLADLDKSALSIERLITQLTKPVRLNVQTQLALADRPVASVEESVTPVGFAVPAGISAQLFHM